MSTTPTKYHPKLSTLINTSVIPGDLKAFEQFVQGGINFLLGDLRYTNYIVEHSPDGDTAFYSLTLLGKELDLPLWGTGMHLVFFHKQVGYSSFPIAMDWRWPIKRYINEFETKGFSYAPDAFLDILLSMADIESEQEVVEEIINIFLSNGTDAYKNAFDELVDTFERLKADWPTIVTELESIKTQIGVIKTKVIDLIDNDSKTLIEIAQDYQDDPAYQDILDAVDIATTSFENIKDTADVDIDIYKVFIEVVLKDITDLDQKFNQLFELFQTWLSNITKEDVEYLLIPQFGFELTEIKMALQFPRKWLVPIIATSQAGGTVYVIDETVTNKPEIGDQIKSAIEFTAGAVKYHTQTGFDIDILNSQSTSLPHCMIPKLDLRLELLNIKLDLSRKKNIAEAIADDRPDDFIGAFIANANIYLPDKWFTFDPDGSTLKLYAKDVLIGTGGVTGIFGLEAVPGMDAKLELPLYLREGNKSVTFDVTGGDSNTTIDIGDVVSIDNVKAEKGRYVLKEGGSIFVDKDGKLEKFASSDGSLSYLFGKKDASGNLEKGAWEIGFNSFYLKMIQNKVIESEIKGFITIPKFKQFIPETQKYLAGDLKINLQAFFENDGDFKMSASPENGLCFGIKDVFYIKVDKLELGQDDAKTYIETSGSIHFDENKFLKKYLKDPIEIDKLRVYSDGSFEIEGGSIPIPAAVTMVLGPVEVSITNITMGSEDVNPKLKFIGFDCGVSAGSAGLDMRGDGIKLMFNEDGSVMYLKINGIGVNLIIPATASEEDAALIIKGYLSMREVEYEGGISFSLPQIGLAGGAAMKMRPKVPAFVIDSFLSLPVPIPLGPTPLGIFSFRGLFGLRYAPDLPDGALQDPKVFFDFYKEKKPNPLNGNNLDNGLHLGKIVYPEDEDMQNTGTPISIGAGLTIATTADPETFSMEAFLFLSIPQFLLISGRANVMGEQVTPMSTDVPFFAYLAITKEFISIGMGADFKMNKDKGEFIEFEIEAQMAFFFNNPSAWYIHLGTKQKPNVARVIKEVFNLNAYAYLMLSAQGVQAGAGMKFDFKKQYGPVKVSANAYLDTWVMMSFKQFQVGGGIALGGSVDIKVFGVGFYIGLDAYLMATLPKPFLIKGGVKVCVVVNLRIKKIKKCADINFKWELDKNVDRTPIGVIKIEENNDFVSAFHIGSEQPYQLNSIVKNNGGFPSKNDDATVIPMDTFIDIMLNKAVNPTDLDSIGGFTNPPSQHIEAVPPASVSTRVNHSFFIEEINIKAWSDQYGRWEEYHPYEALGSDSFMDPTIIPSDLKIGYWQKQGKEYNKMRILSNSPFSFTNNSPNKFIPEQIGMTAGTLFCRAKEKSWHCENWNPENYFIKDKNTKFKDLLIKSLKHDASVVSFQNVFNIPHSIKMSNQGILEIILPEAVLECKTKLFSYAKNVKISFYGIKNITVFEPNEEGIEVEKTLGEEYTLIDERLLASPDWLVDVKYSSKETSIRKIIIEPVAYDLNKANKLKNEIYELELLLLEEPKSKEYKSVLKRKTVELNRLTAISCPNNSFEDQVKDIDKQIKDLEKKQESCKKVIETAQGNKNKYCVISSEKEELLELCFLKGDCIINNDKNCLQHLEERKVDRSLTKIIQQISNLNNKYCETYKNYVSRLHSRLQKEYDAAKSNCEKWTNTLNEKENECKEISEKLRGLREFLEQINPNEKEGNIDKCATYIHQICWLTEEDVLYNNSIPSVAALEAEYDLLRQANKVLAPIWKPDTQYCIEVVTRETISLNSGFKDVDEQYYIQFKTQGPIGHIDLENLSKTVKDQFKIDDILAKPKEYKLDDIGNQILDNLGNPIEIINKDSFLDIPELSLRSYINHKISYPDTTGNIINSKPLYYENPDLKIFYNHPFVYHMFNKWPDYNNLGESDCNVEIRVKDPTENFGITQEEIVAQNLGDHLLPVILQFPVSTVAWKQNENPPIPKGIEAINNLRNPKIKNPDFDGQTCWQIGGDPITPPQKNMEVKVEHLFPSKLYNAVVFSTYNGIEKNTHSYPFQTSRFANLQEHINSYQLKGKAGDTKEAVYTIEIDLKTDESDATSNIINILSIGLGVEEHTKEYEKTLQNYPNTCERLTREYLGLKEYLPPVGVEFNYIVEKNTNHFIGIWIRSVEPLNDPRIPDEVLKTSIIPYYDGNQRHAFLKQYLGNDSPLVSRTKIKSNFDNENTWIKTFVVPIFSADRCEVLILNHHETKLPSDLKLQFKYLLWDNNLPEPEAPNERMEKYEEKDSFTTKNLNI
tara:strand:+ start:8001 stop:14789 length:6789 start_codon:yes stop_codon:yes gene_type:complete